MDIFNLNIEKVEGLVSYLQRKPVIRSHVHRLCEENG